jgi:hypothetical protein
MTVQTKPKKIHAVIGLDKMPDGNVTPLLNASLQGLTLHADVFPKLPVDLPTYASGIKAYEDAIPVALDGSKTAIAHKNKQRNAAVKIYTELAHYVEANCNYDMATFLLSGFTAAAPATRTPPQPLPTPSIASVVPGPLTGQQKVKIGSLKKAMSFDFRFAPPAAAGATPSWTYKTITSRKAFIVDSLTPGTVYTFQVRALGRLGYTEWSDPVNRMAT